MSIVSGEGCETLVSAENPYEFAADRLARAVIMARTLQKARRTGMESTEVFLRRTRQAIEYLEEILRLVATVEGMGFEAVITLPPLDG